MVAVREITQKMIKETDSASSFVILLSASLIPHLEEPINRARFFNYDKKLELYFDSKDINRFSRVKELTTLISKRVKGKGVKGFERFLKSFRENGIMVREKEGPSDGMTWKGFGGVHSHYNLTPLGKALLILQTSLRCSAVNFLSISGLEDWNDVFENKLNLIIDSAVNNRLVIRDFENHFYAKRDEASFVTQRIFEFIAGAPKKVSTDQIKDYIWDKVGEIHLGELPEALPRLNSLLQKSGESYSLNNRGKLARIGYATVLVEAALSIEETELVHYMITAKSLEEGSRTILEHFALWF